MQDIENERQIKSMIADYKVAPAIYHPSEFWSKLNDLNSQWIFQDGIVNFKRSVNNNYFNWMVNTKSTYFRSVKTHFFGNLKRAFRRLPSVILARLGKMETRTYVSDKVNKHSFLQRRIYAAYISMLHDYVVDHDTLGLFGKVAEPATGNPFTVRYRGRYVSQDICNSYLEYLYLRQSLGSVFKEAETIAEVGAGYGRLIYLMQKLRENPKTRLLIIDIPPALFIAQWYLKEVFPDVPIFQYRPFTDFSEIEKELQASRIAFLLPHQLGMLPDKYVDILINISSLQEMRKDQIAHYYDLIDAKAKYFYTKQWSLWQNPNDNLVVPAVIYPTKPSWDLVAARINPVHTDFFEAIFKM